MSDVTKTRQKPRQTTKAWAKKRAAERTEPSRFWKYFFPATQKDTPETRAEKDAKIAEFINRKLGLT